MVNCDETRNFSHTEPSSEHERVLSAMSIDPFSDGDDRSQLGRKRAEVDIARSVDGDVYRNEEPLKEDDDGEVNFSPNFSVSFAVSKRLKKVIKAAPATHASRKIPKLRRG